MTTETVSVKEKLAQAEAALNAGLIHNYAPVTLSRTDDLSEVTSTKSWGSAMRR